MRPTALVALAMLSTLGCSLKRTPIIAGSDGGVIADMDTSSPLDVPSPPGPDVPSVEIDAPTGCTASCAVGERCEGTNCVCASDLCAGNRTCVAGACVACGGGGETCCPGLPCRDGRPCGTEGSCPASRCNTVGEPCCEGDRCDGLTCRGGTCIAACGGDDQACCSTGADCEPWLSCRLWLDLSERCQSCGGFAEPCCPSGEVCEGVMGCAAGRCF